MKLVVFVLCTLSLIAEAGESDTSNAADRVTSADQQIHALDTNHDGLVSIEEMRAYLESLHGADYKKDILDAMVKYSRGRSCGSPFSNSLY